jgi:hypothetical protein
MARLRIRLQVCAKVLNHISGSPGGVAGIYNRHDYADEKRLPWGHGRALCWPYRGRRAFR